MHTLATTAVVFSGGFIVMVLEIIGARFLARDFGSSFYVWVSQIGVVMIALALGYYFGGALADKYPKSRTLSLLLIPAGGLTFALPIYAPKLIDLLISRHPLTEPIALIWQKLDPALGSLLVFLLPCLALATLPPFMIRLATVSVKQVGRRSGSIIAASTLGSIVGVFVAGYILIDHMTVTNIFRATGVATCGLGLFCLVLDPLLSRAEPSTTSTA